jgi:hypothetical protein
LAKKGQITDEYIPTKKAYDGIFKTAALIFRSFKVILNLHAGAGQQHRAR